MNRTWFTSAERSRSCLPCAIHTLYLYMKVSEYTLYGTSHLFKYVRPQLRWLYPRYFSKFSVETFPHGVSSCCWFYIVAVWLHLWNTQILSHVQGRHNSWIDGLNFVHAENRCRWRKMTLGSSRLKWHDQTDPDWGLKLRPLVVLYKSPVDLPWPCFTQFRSYQVWLNVWRCHSLNRKLYPIGQCLPDAKKTSHANSLGTSHPLEKTESEQDSLSHIQETLAWVRASLLTEGTCLPSQGFLTDMAAQWCSALNYALKCERVSVWWHPVYLHSELCFSWCVPGIQSASWRWMNESIEDPLRSRTSSLDSSRWLGCMPNG